MAGSGQARHAAKRTRVRWFIIALLFVAACINYADRATLSITGASLSHDLGLSPITLGYLLSAFAWTYALGQIPGGMLLDRFGSRKVYILSLGLWSAFTLFQGLVGGLPAAAAVGMLFVLRLLLGLAESPSFPANARLVGGWFPTAERGTASAIFNSAQYFAVVVFSPLMGWLTHRFGWPSVFLVMGLIGLVMALIFVWQIHGPLDHRSPNAAEIDYIERGGGLVSLERRGTERSPFSADNFRLLLTNRMLIGIYIGQYCINVLTYFFITWFPIYLVKQRGFSILSAGIVASAPALSGFLGGLLGGIVSDRILKATGSPTLARKAPILFGMLLALLILGCNWATSSTTVIVLMSLAFFGKGMASLGWAVVADVSPPTLIGMTAAIFNTAGNIAGIVTPIVIGYLVAATGSFDVALGFVAGHALLTIFAYFVIVKTIRRVEIA